MQPNNDHSYPRMYLYKRIVQAKLYIDAHFTEPIDLGNIAGEAAFSRFHFLRLFRQCYDKTPHQYLMSRRIALAQQLLTEGALVADTCYATGFESPATFSALFKRSVGTSPAEWQRQQANRQQTILEAPLSMIPGCFAASRGWK